jgi:hypothetical protein
MKMDTPQTTDPKVDHAKGLPVSWITVGLFAIFIAYADGFWFTSLQGAVGAIERSQEPFHSWLRDSTLMVPVIFIAVVGALVLARRWAGGSRWRLVASAVLIVVISTGVGVAELAASAAYDYHLQADQLAVMHSSHPHSAVTSAAPTANVGGADNCNMLCSAKRKTYSAHLRGIDLAARKMLITNIVLVAWILALRGGRLWLPQRRPSPVVDQPISQPPLSGALA